MRSMQSLSPRECLLLLVALPLVALLAGWWLGWVPLRDLRAARETEIAGYRLLAEEASRAGVSPALPDGGNAAPFASRVTESAAAAGLSLSRLEPEGEGLRVTIGEAGFAQVILWLSDLEAERNVLVAAVEMDRRPVPGVVSARVLLEAGP